MLKKVDILSISLKAANFVVELGFLIDQVSVDLLRKQEASTKIERKKETQAAECDVTTESTTKIEILEKSFSQNQEEFDTRAANISAWKNILRNYKLKFERPRIVGTRSKSLIASSLTKRLRWVSTTSNGPINWEPKLIPLLLASLSLDATCRCPLQNTTE